MAKTDEAGAEMKVAPLLIAASLILTSIPLAFADYSQPQGIKQTIVNVTNQPLNSTTGTKATTYNPAQVAGMSQDIGKFSVVTSPSAFSWNVSRTDLLNIGLPSIGGLTVQNLLVYYNSTYTVWQLTSGLNTLEVLFKPTGYSASVHMDANFAVPSSVCFPFTGPSQISQQMGFNFTTGKVTGPLPAINSGSQTFDWSDVSASLAPTWNAQNSSLCMNLPSGVTTIDPIALDGSGRNHNTLGTTLTCTLTTASSPDVIILFARFDEPTDSDLSSVSDTSSLSWTSHGHVASNPAQQYIAEWYAVASGTLTGDVITATSANSGVFNDVTCFGVSGANTSAGTIFDTNAQAQSTCTGAAASCTGPAGGAILASIATNNANDMAIGWGMGFAAASPSAGAPWTSIQCANGNYNCAEYDILSATTASLSLNYGGASMQFSLADAICQSGSSCSAAVTVTQGILITTPNSAPSSTVTITGCSPSNSTFSGDGFTHTYTLTGSCTVTLTLSGSGQTRYKWNISPHATASSTVTFSTCASGTCSVYQNTSYYQLDNIFEVTPTSPATWDGAYGVQVTGTFLGVAASDIVVKNGGSDISTVAGGGVRIVCALAAPSCWADYNLNVCTQTPIGNTWIATPPNCFLDTTGNNTHNVNYTQNKLALATLILAGIVFGFMVIGLFVAYRRRR